MAQTRRKRRRKHKGTQAGTIEHRSRTGQARTREDAKEISRRRRQERLDRHRNRIGTSLAGLDREIRGLATTAPMEVP